MSARAPDVSTKGLRVLVTAGASGIGRATAETFQAAGAKVHICDVSTDALAQFKQANPGITQSVCDVSDLRQVDQLFADVRKHLGGLDALINNAGIAGPTAVVEETKPEDWERTMAVNLNGMFYCTRLGVPMLKAAGGGSIANLSSTAGRLGFPYRSPYAATKWGVIGFTQSIAMELGEFNIRVNAILPGVVAGDRIDRVMTARAQARGISVEQAKKEAVEHVSMRTMVSAQDIANMIVFLASDAGKHVSGQSMPVCGNVETLR
jgi:NAD(P)-dependent dehydrogenase (short-subunit alcohol dehydrogenase family)